jgi:hypothetical protein
MNDHCAQQALGCIERLRHKIRLETDRFVIAGLGDTSYFFGVQGYPH